MNQQILQIIFPLKYFYQCQLNDIEVKVSHTVGGKETAVSPACRVQGLTAG